MGGARKRMMPLTQILVGMAAAGVTAGPGRPAALLAGAVAGVLPDLVDGWSRLLRKPDLVVTPDPNTPDPAVMAQGIRLALQQVRASGRPCLVRFNPLPDAAGGFASYYLDCDRLHRLMTGLEFGARPVRVYPAAANADDEPDETFSPVHPVPLFVADVPVDLQLAAVGRRVESRDLGRMAGPGHSLALLGVALPVLAFQAWIGAAVFAALALHLLLTFGGRQDVSLFWPFSGRVLRGRRAWNDRGWRANLCMAAMAGGVLAVLLLNSGA